MKNKFIVIFLAMFLFLIAGCEVIGTLPLRIEAVTTSIVGESIQFKGILDEGEEFKKAIVYIFDIDGQQIDTRVLTGNLEYLYKFDITGTYTIEYYVETTKNYGTAMTNLLVEYKERSIIWKIADEPLNKTSILFAKDPEGNFIPAPVDFYLTKLATIKDVDSIDVKLIQEADSGSTTIYFEKTIKNAKFTYTPEFGKYGSIKLVAYLNLKDGNAVRVEDYFVILDPDNPVSILLSASNNDKNYTDTIFVEGRVSVEGTETIKSLQIIRRCYYGKEKGVYPLAQPHKDPATEDFYTLAGKDFEVHEEIYEAFENIGTNEDPNWVAKDPDGKLLFEEDGITPIYEEDGITQKRGPAPLLKYYPEDKKFVFLDPMPYYNEEGNEESTGFKWDYAKFDREAWKAILRKKNVDMTRMVGVEYIAQAKIGDKEYVKTNKSVGIPYLSTIPMAQFCMWLKETAMNRLWHMQVPRFCWSKSSSWLMSAQNHNGMVSGNAYYSAGLSGGGGAIKNYSDWPDLKLFTNRDISVSGIKLETNVRRSHDVDLTIISSIWPQMTFKIQGLGVRDYTLQWGAWIDKEGGACYGNLYLKRGSDSEEGVDGASLATFMPTYLGWGPRAGYGYEEFDATGTDDETLGASWTKINFKYRPTPTAAFKTGPWSENSEQWYVKYMVE